MVVHQVADCIPAYEVKDEAGNIFLWLPQWELSHPWE